MAICTQWNSFFIVLLANYKMCSNALQLLNEFLQMIMFILFAIVSSTLILRTVC